MCNILKCATNRRSYKKYLNVTKDNNERHFFFILIFHINISVTIVFYTFKSRILKNQMNNFFFSFYVPISHVFMLPLDYNIKLWQTVNIPTYLTLKYTQKLEYMDYWLFLNPLTPLPLKTKFIPSAVYKVFANRNNQIMCSYAILSQWFLESMFFKLIHLFFKYECQAFQNQHHIF